MRQGIAPRRADWRKVATPARRPATPTARTNSRWSRSRPVAGVAARRGIDQWRPIDGGRRRWRRRLCRKRITSSFSGVTVTTGDGALAAPLAPTTAPRAAAAASVPCVGHGRRRRSRRRRHHPPHSHPTGRWGAGSSGDFNVTGGAGWYGLTLEYHAPTTGGNGGIVFPWRRRRPSACFCCWHRRRRTTVVVGQAPPTWSAAGGSRRRQGRSRYRDRGST